MKNFHVLALVAIAIASPGCQACMYGTSARLNDIAVGMPKAKAIEKIGTPDSTYARDGAEYLIYKWMKTVIDWWPKYYYVKIVDGKVDSYGEQKDLRDKERPQAPAESSTQ